jgi:hypothetical protein
MTELTINSISGFTLPFSGYGCDVYGNNCIYIGEIITTPTTITLPSQFNNAPIIGLKLIDNSGCEKFKTIVCDDVS